MLKSKRINPEKLELAERILREAEKAFAKITGKILNDENSALIKEDTRRFQEESDRILGELVRHGLLA